MRTLSLLSLVASSLFLLACDPVDQGGASSENLALSSGSSGGQALSGTSPQAIEIPEFEYPENVAIELERVIHVRNLNGILERTQETFLADGLGNIRLNVTGFSPDQAQAFATPSTMLQMNYLNQMRFMVKYRDPHLGAQTALLHNFTWTEDAVPVQVAGVNCIRYTAKSLQRYGDVEFLADAQTGLLLGWTQFDASGAISMKMEATSVNLSPSLAGVAWSVPLVAEQAFSGPNDFAALGYEPMEPAYLPAGFYQEEAWLRFSGPSIPGISNMLVKVYSDGIHLVFVAQANEATQHLGLQFANRVTDVFESDLGGIRVAEGSIGERRLYVASLLSMEEIETIFGSIYPH
ncbi:MAG: hypothetical protein O3A95_02035 [Planctomycetota bacterium]|nr:hypothetical protein [Planctomycetota bacterium]MDA1113063.1 hypothetical protein [Planctomycetota bacterium]